MAIIKLVCQGCGANLDALDNQRVLQCGYCGTTNQIKQTVYEQRPPQPPPAQPPIYQQPPVYQQPPAPIQFQTVQQAQGRARSGLIAIVVISAIFPLVIGLFVTFAAISTTTDVIEQIPGFAGTPAQVAAARRYRWESERPFVADVNGDGTDDLIGLIQEIGSQDVQLTATSGTDWATLWQISLGNRANIPGRPQIRYEPQTKLVLFAVGAALTAYDAQTGTQRWVSNLSDAVEAIALDGEQLQVWTIDKQTAALGLGDGKPIQGAKPPAEGLTLLRDDIGYDLIPDIGTLDLEYNQFTDLRVQAGYCPKQDLPFTIGRLSRSDEIPCSFPYGLAWASRAQGTQVPFFIGYDRKTKAERWRVQLTTPGTLETVDSGMSQPRAELFGDAAIVSFQPDNQPTKIRRISLVDGASQWEASIPQKPGGRLTGMVLGKDRVFVNYGDQIHVLDLGSGAAQTKLGNW